MSEQRTVYQVLATKADCPPVVIWRDVRREQAETLCALMQRLVDSGGTLWAYQVVEAGDTDGAASGEESTP